MKCLRSNATGGSLHNCEKEKSEFMSEEIISVIKVHEVIDQIRAENQTCCKLIFEDLLRVVKQQVCG